MSLADIIRSIAKATPRTSAELTADLASIDMPALERRVDELEDERRRLLVHGTDNQIEAITLELNKANLAAERAQAARDELAHRQIPEAEARERLASVEKQAAEAKAARVRVIKAYVDLHDAATEVTRLLSVIRDGEATIRKANGVVAAAERRDLKTPWPRTELMALVGAGDSQFPDPTAWQMHGYWPNSPLNGGTGLGGMLNVPLRVDWRFDRAAELLNVQPRKAA